MNEATQISAEAHEAAHIAIKVEVRNGKPVYILYGMLEVTSLELARELLTDRRVTPRHVPEPTLQAFKFPWE